MVSIGDPAFSLQDGYIPCYSSGLSACRFKKYILLYCRIKSWMDVIAATNGAKPESKEHAAGIQTTST